MFYAGITQDDETFCQVQSIFEVSTLNDMSKEDGETYEEYVTMGKFRVEKEFSVASIVYHPDFLDKNTHMGKMHLEYLQYLDKFPEKKEDFLKAVKFLASEFAKPVADDKRYEYKISAAFTKIVLAFGLSGVLYPSVKGEGKGFNIAIDPSYIKNKILRLEKLAVWRLQKRNKNLFIEPYLYCETFGNDGRFIWQDAKVYVPAMEAEKVLNRES
jgi:hypothetical protein